MQPLADIDMGEFYDLDTFSEEAYLAQKRQGMTIDSGAAVDNLVEDGINDTGADEDMDEGADEEMDSADDDDDNDNTETVEETTPKASKAVVLKGKHLAKRQRVLEKVKVRIDKYEKEEADATVDEKVKAKNRKVLKKLTGLKTKLEAEIAAGQPLVAATAAKKTGGDDQDPQTNAPGSFTRPLVEDVDQSKSEG